MRCWAALPSTDKMAGEKPTELFLAYFFVVYNAVSWTCRSLTYSHNAARNLEPYLEDKSHLVSGSVVRITPIYTKLDLGQLEGTPQLTQSLEDMDRITMVMM